MTPTSEIAARMSEAAILSKFQPASYRKWKRNVEAAKRRAMEMKRK